MKFLLFILVLICIFSLIVTVLSNFSDSNKKSKKKNVRNYKVRFDAVAEKYYIVNELDTYDEPITNWLGKRVMYSDKPKATFIAEKLNT